MTRIAASTAKPVAPQSDTRRRRLSCCEVEGGKELSTWPRSSAGDTPNQQSRQRVHDQRDDKQRQANLNQSAEIHVPCGLCELVGNYARHCVAGSEQRFGNLWPVTDQHGH